MGYLQKIGAEIGVETEQRDLGIHVILRLFSKDGLRQVRDVCAMRGPKSTEAVQFFLDAFSDYENTIEPVVQFLQGKDPSLAHRIAARTLLPEGPRFQQLDAKEMDWAFGTLGAQDKAKFIASLYIDDLADIVRDGVDVQFGLSKYAEKLSASNPSFDNLHKALNSKPTLIDSWIEEEIEKYIKEIQPDVLGLSVPFPGCLYGGLRAAKKAKSLNPKLKVALGGGYVNTELRSLNETRLFEIVDAVLLDDGEKPFRLWLESLRAGASPKPLLRTFVLENGKVEFKTSTTEHDIPQKDCGIPTTRGLDFGNYLSMVEILNPMQRLWTDLQWNKIMLAHGCYWKKCNFCDVTLDYIGRYDASAIDLTVERMKSLSNENGISGFHFVDEAAPPAVLRKLSEALIQGQYKFSWWGNIRFDKIFTPEMTELMADGGCVAISGGLEAASDRLLEKMNKGVTVEQVARVTKNFRNSKILVHAYLMYGFPTETLQETIDSLERVRQLFKEGCLNSAFWHRFSATAHSPIGQNPEQFGIEVKDPKVKFARNDLEFQDPTDCDHDALGAGLRRAVYNFMHGIGLDADVREWFDPELDYKKLPKTTVSKSLIRDALRL